jgi:hypothetical protein
MRNASEKNLYRNHPKAYSLFNNCFSENLAGYEIMWKNMVQPDRPQMAI